MLRLVFHLALRQAKGFATSILGLLGQKLRVPDHTPHPSKSRSLGGEAFGDARLVRRVSAIFADRAARFFSIRASSQVLTAAAARSCSA